MVQQIVFNAVWTSALGFKLWCGGEKERLAQQLPVMSAYDSNTMQQCKRKIRTEKYVHCYADAFYDLYEVDSEEKNKGIIIE